MFRDTMANSAAQPKSATTSSKAEQAFADYVALGRGRSYRALAADYVKQNRYKTETTAFNAIAKWAGQYHWQDRIAAASSEEAERKLSEAADIDADTSLMLARETNRRAKWADALKIDELIKMRESVRKPTKGGASVDVNVNVSVEIRQMVERIAEEDGLTEDEKRELMASVERHLSGSAK